jgi:hypothetical protein
MVRESVNARSWRLDRDKGKSFESLSFRGLREGRFTDLSRRPKQRIHRHGCYLRFENCEDQQRLRIERFVSPRCGRTLSLCPKAGSLRCLEHRDGGIGVRCPGLGHRFTSHERGCLWRAFERFAARVTSLCALLGQMIGPIKPSVGECCGELRQLDNLEGILLRLGTKLNTSLLADSC